MFGQSSVTWRKEAVCEEVCRVRDFIYRGLESSEHSRPGEGRDGHCGKMSHWGRGGEAQSSSWNPWYIPDSRPDTEDTKMNKTKMSHPFRIRLRQILVADWLVWLV